MVDRDIAARGIRDERVLSAFRTVPREEFVPEAARLHAYADHPLTIGHGQTISQPYIVALMARELRVRETDRVLEIGTGSGYQTALLAEMASTVYTIERIEELATTARERLDRMGHDNIHYRVGDGTLGWPEEAPFDRIAVGAGAPRVPQPLVDQLAESGRMALPVGGVHHQDLVVVEKRRGKTIETTVCGCIFVKLIGKEAW